MYEKTNKEQLVEFEEKYPNVLNENNLEEIMGMLREKENNQAPQVLEQDIEVDPDDEEPDVTM